jgi:hypothetical protein
MGVMAIRPETRWRPSSPASRGQSTQCVFHQVIRLPFLSTRYLPCLLPFLASSRNRPSSKKDLTFTQIFQDTNVFFFMIYCADLSQVKKCSTKKLLMVNFAHCCHQIVYITMIDI